MASALAKTSEFPASLNSTVLIVDDEQSVCDMIAAVLEPEGYTVVTANSGEEAMSKFGEFVFDVMFTDICMDGMDGLDLLQRVSLFDKSVKSIVITAFSGYETAIKALKAGAFDYIEKPLDNHEILLSITHKARQFSQLERDNLDLLSSLKSQHTKLQAANRQLAELNDKLEALALTDSLTGLKNRRYIDTIHQKECARYLRYKEPFSVVMIDVDHFKQYNDRYGHSAGDEALRFVAAQLLDCTRDSDTVGRYGGEEFFILLSNTAPLSAAIVAERILQNIQTTKFTVDDVETQLSVSIGIAGLDGVEQIQSQVDLIERSDKALYHAKNQGRNQLQLFDPSMLDTPE